MREIKVVSKTQRNQDDIRPMKFYTESELILQEQDFVWLTGSKRDEEFNDYKKIKVESFEQKKEKVKDKTVGPNSHEMLSFTVLRIFKRFVNIIHRKGFKKNENTLFRCSSTEEKTVYYI